MFQYDEQKISSAILMLGYAKSDIDEALLCSDLGDIPEDLSCAEFLRGLKTEIQAIVDKVAGFETFFASVVEMLYENNIINEEEYQKFINNISEKLNEDLLEEMALQEHILSADSNNKYNSFNENFENVIKATNKDINYAYKDSLITFIQLDVFNKSAEEQKEILNSYRNSGSNTNEAIKEFAEEYMCVLFPEEMIKEYEEKFNNSRDNNERAEINSKIIYLKEEMAKKQYSEEDFKDVNGKSIMDLISEKDPYQNANANTLAKAHTACMEGKITEEEYAILKLKYLNEGQSEAESYYNNLFSDTNVDFTIKFIDAVKEVKAAYDKAMEDGYFGFMDRLSTEAVVAGSVINGTIDLIEGIGDAAITVGGTVVSLGGSATDIFTGGHVGEDIRNWTKGVVAYDWSNALYDSFYKTAVGQYINTNSLIKYDGAVSNVISEFTKTAEIGAITAVSGGSGATVGAVISGFNSMGHATENYWQENDDYWKGLAYGAATGTWDAAQWYMGSKIGKSLNATNATEVSGKIENAIFNRTAGLNHLQKSLVSAGSEFIVGAADGFVKSGIDSIISDEGYWNIFNNKYGGTGGVIKNGLIASIMDIGFDIGSSALGKLKKNNNITNEFNKSSYQKISNHEFKKMSEKQSISKYDFDRIYDPKMYGHGYGYVGSCNSFDINDELRVAFENGTIPVLSSNQEEVVESLKRVVSTNKTTKDIFATRELDMNYLSNTFGLDVQNLSNLEIVGAINNMIGETKSAGGGFFSVALNDNKVLRRKVVLNCYIPKGTNAFVTNNFSESEMILGTETTTKILEANQKKVKGINKIVIDVLIN